MKRGAIWVLLTCLIVTSLVLVSCTKTTTTSTTSTTTTTTASTTITTTTPTSATNTTTTTAVTTGTSTTGHWWDSLGTPQYGGKMVIQTALNLVSFDPYQGELNNQVFTGYLEQLFMTDWTMDPSVQNYKLSFWSNAQAVGCLVQTWEFTSPGTFVLHVRHGVYWQNISPANGREFIANDIVYHYNRMLGLGSGFSKAAPYWGTASTWKSLTSITAPDKYTVIMTWSTPNPEFVTENMQAPGAGLSIECPDAVSLWGDLNDWHHAIGTGPFILTDFVDSSSATLTKNPNYWGVDERYPQNKLPYVQTIKYLIIPNQATALAAVRVGKIDLMDSIPLVQAQSMKKTNPSIVQIQIPTGNAVTLDPRNDKTPFSDLRVRQALQMAIDLPTIAQTYYGGTADPWPCPLTSNYMVGWGFPYSQWPQDLKDQYTFNQAGAKALLAAAGVANLSTDIVVDSAADQNLLLIVQGYFAQVGVNMEIRVMDSASFAAFVSSGHKNDALAMRTQGALGVTYYPLRQFTKFQTGASSNDMMVSDPVWDAFYPQALAATSTDALKTLLMNANKYAAQQHFAISLLQPMQYSLCQAWLKGFNAQYSAISGFSGPLLLFEYGARFWIDQTLKTSMGY